LTKCFYLLPDGNRIDLIIATKLLKEVYLNSEANLSKESKVKQEKSLT